MVVRVPTGKQVTSSVMLPMSVRYKCPYCGKDNCISFKKKFQSTAQGTLFDDPEELKKASKRMIMDQYGQMQKYINNKQYGKLRINILCSFCKKAAPWGNYSDWKNVKTSSFVLYGLAYALVMLVILFQIHTLGGKGIPLIVATVILLICAGIFPLCYGLKKRGWEKRRAMLSEEFLPKFYLELSEINKKRTEKNSYIRR